MSVIIKKGSDICKANTNTSTAKFQYSFSKASRFPTPNMAEEIRKKRLNDLKAKGNDVVIKESHYRIYKLPSTLSQRKTTFGYGKKSDFTKGGNYCKEACYNPGTDFDPKNPHGPKYSFTQAPRSGKKKIEKKKKEGEENEEKKDDKTAHIVDPDGPSPAAYNYLKPFGYDAPKVTMKGRHETPIKRHGEKEGEENEKKEEKKEPQFTKVSIQITTSGKYPVSQIPNVNSIKMDKDKSKRTQFEANKNPAPNEHPLPKLLGGHIIESQYRSYEPITIAGKHYVKDSRSNYPGPGSYVIPSDFGIYESKDADKYTKENVYPEKKIEFEEKAWRHNMKPIEPKKPKKNNRYNNNNNDEDQKQENNNNNDEEQNQDENNNNEITPGYTPREKEETPGNKNVEGEKKYETPENNIKDKKETPGNKNEEEKKEEEKNEKIEKDKKSECILLKEILEYKEESA